MQHDENGREIDVMNFNFVNFGYVLLKRYYRK